MTRSATHGQARRRLSLFAVIGIVVAAGLQSLTPGAHATEPLRWTSPGEIVARATTWVDLKVPYSQTAQAPDVRGKAYRTDCSGFISMAWGLNRSLTTLTLPSVATPLGPVGDYAGLRTGDLLDTTANRHAVLFVRWADAARTTAVVMEEPHPGAVARTDSTHYTRALLAAEGFVAYRYDRVRTPVSMDWTGDGYPDVIARSTVDGRLWLFPGPAAARHKPRLLARGWAPVKALVELADVDRSGDPALVALRTDGSVWSYLRGTRGDLGAPRRVTGSGVSYDSIAPAGELDPIGLLAHTADGTVSLLGGDGAGGFRSSRPLGTGWTAGELVVSAGAVGADGFPQLFGRTADGTVWLHAGDGHGGWAVPRPVLSAQVVGGLPTSSTDSASGLNRLLKLGRQEGAVAGIFVSGVGERGDAYLHRADGSLWLLRVDGHGGFAAPARVAGRWSAYDLVL